jgi:hypothetical protein
MIQMVLNMKPLQSQIQKMQFRMQRGCPSQDIHTWCGRLDTTVEEPKANLGPNGRTTSKMHCLRKEWTGDRPDHGHKTERDSMPFAKPLNLMVEED